MCATRPKERVATSSYDPGSKPRLDGYAIKVPVFGPPFGEFPNVFRSLGPEKPSGLRFGFRRMKSTDEAIYYQGPEGGACPHVAAGFCHCEPRSRCIAGCGAKQRQVYGERSMDLSH